MIRGLFDFHIGEHVSEIRFDLPAYVAQVRRLGIEVLVFMSKDAMGLSYYDTRAGRRNPRLRGDPLRDAIALAHCRGIKVMPYFNVALDDYLGESHPDWRQVDAHGKADIVFGYYTALCLNSPYRDVVRAQLEELARDYDSDGLWFDITYVFPGRCYCPYCRSRFREIHGLDMPASPEPGSADMDRYLEFRRRTRREFITDFASAVRRIRGPDFPLGWNHAGDIDFCQVEIDRLASLGSCEFHAPAFDDGFFKANAMRASGKPFELMMPECLSAWGEWTVAPVPTMKTMAAVALAAGASLNLGHVAVPSGPLAGAVAGPVVEHYAAMSRWARKRLAWCEGATAVPCAALLSSVANQRLMGRLQGLPYDASPASVNGAHRVLLDCHWPVDVLSEETLEGLSRYEAALVPEMLHVPDTVADALAAYVRGGGVLVVEGRSGVLDAAGGPLSDFRLANLTGTHRQASCELTSRYLAGLPTGLSDGLPDMPILVHSASGFVNAGVEAGVEVLARFMDPEFEGRPRRHVYHQQGHPAVSTEWPAIVVRRVGSGRVVHILAPLGESYLATGHPWLRLLLGNLLRTVVPEPLLRVTAPPSVRVTAMARDGALLIHLVHWHLEPRTQGPSFVECELPVPGIRISVRQAGTARVLQVGARTRELPFRRKGGRIEVVAAPVRTHAVIVIEQHGRNG